MEILTAPSPEKRHLSHKPAYNFMGFTDILSQAYAPRTPGLKKTRLWLAAQEMYSEWGDAWVRFPAVSWSLEKCYRCAPYTPAHVPCSASPGALAVHMTAFPKAEIYFSPGCRLVIMYPIPLVISSFRS